MDDKYIQYMINAGGRVSIGKFDDDWQPIAGILLDNMITQGNVVLDDLDVVLTLPHTFEKHTNCEINHCQLCEGGLSYCTTCKGCESSLSTHCIGKPLTEHDHICISNGDDYKNGKWYRVDIHS